MRRDWHLAIAPDNAAKMGALEAHQGEYLGFVRMVGRRRGGLGGADREPASAVYEAVATARGQGVILWGGPANNKVK